MSLGTDPTRLRSKEYARVRSLCATTMYDP
jgi:hypothetical protein